MKAISFQLILDITHHVPATEGCPGGQDLIERYFNPNWKLMVVLSFNVMT
jgi:hypothetical protein